MDSIGKKYYWADIANTTEIGHYLTRKELGLLRAFFQGKNIKSCLDIGCGSGRLGSPICDMGVKVTGLENKLLPLNELQRNDSRIPVVLGNGTCLPFKDSCFDCIILIEVIDYFTNIDDFILECHRVLTKHGYLCFTFSNASSWKRFAHRLLANIGPFTG